MSHKSDGSEPYTTRIPPYLSKSDLAERSEFLGMVLHASSRLKTLVLASARCDGAEEEMLKIRLHSPEALVVAEPLIENLRTVWHEGTSLVHMTDTTSGFELRFAHVGNKGGLLTGLLSVDLSPGAI